MFLPNTKGMLSRRGARDLYSQATYAAPVEVACAVVTLNGGAQKTSVRTDSSASRANAEEKVAVAKILFPRTVQVLVDDKFEIAGFVLRALAVQPRFAVPGHLDHYEVDFGRWAQ